MNRGRTRAAHDPATLATLPPGGRSFTIIVKRLFASGLLPVVGMLLVWSFLRSPIPSVNEPHYFCKAKHFWDLQWCANDFFLASSNPHFIFYCCFGPITEYLSLTGTALIARIVSLTLLAWGWIQITAPLLRSTGQKCLAMSLFLLLQALVNFSGEWLVGGAEAKVISYGFALGAIGAWQQNKTNQTALLTGIAVTFHSLVGCWLTIAFLMEYTWRHRKRFAQSPTQIVTDGIQSWRAVALWILCSLPGLLPSLQLLFSQADAKTNFAGNYLQVYFRLKHHLDPMEFEWWRYVSYAVMFVVVVLCFGRLKKESENVSQKARILLGILGVSLLIAGVGVLLAVRFSHPSEMYGLKWRIDLLKFYPFRFFDLLTPLIGSILVVATASSLRKKESASAIPEKNSFLPINQNTRLHLSWIGLLLIALCIPFADKNPSRMSANKKESWLEVCQWVNQNTQEDSLFITPRCSWAFKWYAQRAEFVTRKDCPQDAPGIIEWNNRLRQINAWKRLCFSDRLYDREETASLARQTGANYLIANRISPIELSPVFRNEYFRVYRIGIDKK